MRKNLIKLGATMINRKLPLLDIHRHLDGNVRAQTILELGRQFNIDLPADNVEQLIPHVQVIDPEPNLVAFFTKARLGRNGTWRLRFMPPYCY